MRTEETAMPRRDLHLESTPLAEALGTYLARASEHVTPRVESIATSDALDRVTATATFASVASPSCNTAAMDGIALESERTRAATELTPLRLRVGTDYQLIDTGDPLSPPYDAVVMTEDVSEIAEGVVEIIAAAAPCANVRPIGEDFAQGEMLLPSYHIVRPVDICLLLSGGITSLAVTTQPTVAIIPTAPDGLVTLSKAKSLEGDMRTDQDVAVPSPNTNSDPNSHMIAALVDESGGLPRRLPLVSDDYDTLKATIAEAVTTHDIVLINAGSSTGAEDYTASILRELGEVVIHGVAIKPGKPVILALVKGTPVIGLPGYPLATFFNFNTFAKPVMELFTGIPRANRAKIKATLAKRLTSSLEFREYVQVNVGLVGEKLIAAPLSRGSGVVSSLVRADGYLIIDQEIDTLAAGVQVEVNLYRDLYEVAHTVLAMGSHDLALDIVADLMPQLHSHAHLSSTHVGSRAGLNALKRGEAHIAPCCLLDRNTGSYNIPAIREVLGDEPMALIKGFQRNRLDAPESGFEEYDFAIPQAFLDLEHVQAFIATLKSSELHARLAKIGGYGFDHTGEVVLLDERDPHRPFGFCRF
jgi:putative molybdopterin biosynthesis protein